AFTPALILFIVLPESEDKTDPGCPRSRCNCCRDVVRCAATKPSLVTADGASKRTTSGTIGSGFAAGYAGRAGKLSRLCPCGLLPTGTIVSIAGNRPGNRCMKQA